MKEVRFYHLDIKKKVLKVLKKTDEKLRKICIKKINNLAKIPFPQDKKHILDIKKDRMLCELAIDKIRIYYEITQGKVIINDILYLGKVEVKNGSKSHKAGSKGHFGRQQKDIKKMKINFKKD